MTEQLMNPFSLLDTPIKDLSLWDLKAAFLGDVVLWRPYTNVLKSCSSLEAQGERIHNIEFARKADIAMYAKWVQEIVVNQESMEEASEWLRLNINAVWGNSFQHLLLQRIKNNPKYRTKYELKSVTLNQLMDEAINKFKLPLGDELSPQLRAKSIEQLKLNPSDWQNIENEQVRFRKNKSHIALALLALSHFQEYCEYWNLGRPHLEQQHNPYKTDREWKEEIYIKGMEESERHALTETLNKKSIRELLQDFKNKHPIPSLCEKPITELINHTPSDWLFAVYELFACTMNAAGEWCANIPCPDLNLNAVQREKFIEAERIIGLPEYEGHKPWPEQPWFEPTNYEQASLWVKRKTADLKKNICRGETRSLSDLLFPVTEDGWLVPTVGNPKKWEYFAEMFRQWLSNPPEFFSQLKVNDKPQNTEIVSRLLPANTVSYNGTHINLEPKGYKILKALFDSDKDLTKADLARVLGKNPSKYKPGTLGSAKNRIRQAFKNELGDNFEIFKRDNGQKHGIDDHHKNNLYLT